MTSEQPRETNKDLEKGPVFGVRHLQTILLFLNFVVVYISRLNVAVTVVAMTNAKTSNNNFPEYDWNEKHKSYIISSFYFGYVLTQFPGGYLARRFGCKIVLFVSTIVSALFTLITPVCIPWGGWQIYCGIRIIQGILQGAMYPCIQAHIATWSPPQERNVLGAICHSGIDCGTVFAMAISGIIAEGPMGWPGISYISGALCLLWCILWLIFGANNAPASKICTPEERHYIESSLQRADGFHRSKIPIPWRAILTSVPVYVLVITRFAVGYGFSTTQAEIPSYMNGVMKLNIKANALFSALPYLTMWILSYVNLIIADVIMKRKWITLTVLRKTFNTISFWVPAVGLIGVGFFDGSNKTLVIVLMTIVVGASSATTIGCLLISLDLSSNHAGIIEGILNCIENLSVMLTPLVTGLIVVDESDRTQWQTVFLIAALVFFVGNIVFLIWGTTDEQPWNAEDYLSVKSEEEIEDGHNNLGFLDEQKMKSGRNPNIPLETL